MALSSQLPIRLEVDVDERLQAVAQRTGTTKSALIRMLAKTFVDQCVSADGRVSLPPEWKELLPSRDNRSDKPNSKTTDRDGVEINVQAGKGASVHVVGKKKSTSTYLSAADVQERFRLNEEPEIRSKNTQGKNPKR